MTEADLIVIGAGPGGYEIAQEVASKGKKVVLIEKDSLGGTCLNRGCIPTKCLCSSASMALAMKDCGRFGVEVQGVTFDYGKAVNRMAEVVSILRDGVSGLLKDVTVVKGEARISGKHEVTVGDKVFTAPLILIATGSRPVSLDIPGASLAISSDDFLKLDRLPRSVAVIGGGVIGLEFASILAAFDVDVTVVEYCKEVLPSFDRDIAKRLRSMLSRRGIRIITGAGVSEIREGIEVEYQGKSGAEAIRCETAVMAVGRRPVVPDGCAVAGIELTDRGFIKVDDLMRTTAPGICAVGDVNGLCMLAHAASAQARVALGYNVNPGIIPSAVFTIPEAAMVGMTEERCLAGGIDFSTSKSMFASNGKALAMGEGEGFVKVIYSPESRLLLGCHAVGPHAADIVAEAAAAMQGSLTTDDVASLIHGHPTLSETLMAACRACR